MFPATHLTPYVGIHSVPPSSCVVIRNGKQTVRKYWDFDPAKQIRYRSDGEFEEHFCAVFAEAVRRRLRSDSPILAELSGGIDSSSIVCMADTLIAHGAPPKTPRLDTISYYDDSEPNWNERPYFTKVEEKRSRTGTHIDVHTQEFLNFELDRGHFAATPSASGGRPSETGRKISACMASQGNRVVLSGIGGDEVTGGVPTPIPILQDLLARGHFMTLAHQLRVWALNKRRPWFSLLFDAARGFSPPALGVPKHKRPPAWFSPVFINRNRGAMQGYESRLKLFGSLPSFQDHLKTLNALRRQLTCDAPSLEPVREKRYPYLDRSLLEFMYAVPLEQLIRPGQRRSLMRRALTGMVPDELLNRKRKAFVTRSPRVGIAAQWPRLLEFSQNTLLSLFEITDATRFESTLKKAREGGEVPIVILMRTIVIEAWLRSIKSQLNVGAPVELANKKKAVGPIATN